MSSVRRIAPRSSGSSAPNTTRMITSSVSACMRGWVANAVPRGQRSTSAAASSAIRSRCARMRSPWNGGSISLRWRRCGGPSRMRIELRPTNGSRKLELSPAVRTSGEAVNTVRTSAGSETTTIGASVHAVRSVNGTPKRAALRRSSTVGRASHSQVWRAGGADGPGGSTARRRYDVRGCSTPRRWPPAARHVTAELAGADREQLEIQRGGAERVGDGEPAVERDRGLERAVDLGHKYGVVSGGVGQELPGGAVAVERAEADERRSVGRRGGADDDVSHGIGARMRAPSGVPRVSRLGGVEGRRRSAAAGSIRRRREGGAWSSFRN